eukprot:TRINITY_DN10845_c0_g1_i5.p1 TRINITY_DN10845_c0_g1~~TRINITY_DN10845_c0_g1_i5.p1  ORF type:complete len:364 (-),score=67.51 TRINITY_DN10845_c0_g1_i5:561-1652(-)
MCIRDRYPGSSRLTIETYVPCTTIALEEFANIKTSISSPKAISVAMAKTSFLAAQNLYLKELDYTLPKEFKGFYGVGIIKDETNGAVLSVFSEKIVSTTAVTIVGGETESERDILLSEFFTFLIGKYCSVVTQATLEEFLESKPGRFRVSEPETISHPTALDLILDCNFSNVFLSFDGRMFLNLSMEGFSVLAGSFDPLHDAHRDLARITAVKNGIPSHKVVFEICIHTPGKPTLDWDVVQTRVAQFREENKNVLLTDKPLFWQKNDFFTDCHFAVGTDTFRRVVDVKFYDHNYDKMLFAFGHFAARNNRLLVFPRVDPSTGVLERLADFPLPAVLSDRVGEVADYRRDISSTELRALKQKLS